MQYKLDTPLLRLNPGYAYNWVDIDFEGNCLAVPEGFDDYYLDPPWNDVISSAAYPYSTSEYKAYALCEDIYYGGDKWVLIKGAESEDFFGEVNFNDMASSVCWGK